MKRQIWQRRMGDPMKAKEVAAKLNISVTLAQILQNRGICSHEEGETFLFGTLGDMTNPLEINGIHQGVSRIREALEKKEEILIYGDYDVDGVTSTALLVLALRELGGQVSFHLPNRFSEGYGLNSLAIERAKEEGISLIITVDCGISNWEESQRAKELGIDLIVTDHHEPGNLLPTATALINPKLQGEGYPWSQLSGVGVAFKLVQALFYQLEGKSLAEAGKEYLDIVALGTIADLVPLRDENRIIVREGLELLTSSSRPGIEALKTVCNLKDRRITAGNVGFMLAPRLNAGGRLGDAKQGVELLITQSPTKAMELAIFLDAENQERQRIEGEIFEEAVNLVEEKGWQKEPALVLASPNWHAGVIGIVASRLVERYHRPTVLIAIEKGIGKSSCRSIAGFHLFEALQKCSSYLLKFGGHAMAAGLSIDEGQISAFKNAFQELARESLSEEDYTPKVKIDQVINIDDVSMDLLEELRLLEPFGMGNPSPLLGSNGVNLTEAKVVGKGKDHLKITVGGKKESIGGIGFNLGHALVSLNNNSKIDVAYALETNTWQEKVSLQLNVKALKDAKEPDNPFIFNRLTRDLREMELGEGLRLLTKEIPPFRVLDEGDLKQAVAWWQKEEVKLSCQQMDLNLFYNALTHGLLMKVAHPTAKIVEHHYGYLTKMLSGAPINICRYHQGMSKEARVRSLTQLREEKGTICLFQEALARDLEGLPWPGKKITYIGYAREKEYDSYLQALKGWEGFLTGNVEELVFSPLEEDYEPKREELIWVYSSLIKAGIKPIPLAYVIGSCKDRLAEEKVIFALIVFEQLGFIDIIFNKGTQIIIKPKPEGKVDLSEAPLFREQLLSAQLYQRLVQDQREVAVTLEA